MIITTDLHLTSSERDRYRWDVFPWLAQTMKETDSDEILILGDLTDAKDGHSADLVNRTADALDSLPGNKWLIKGNHDCVDHGQPFFDFMNKVPDVRFVVDPETAIMSGGNVLMLPHSRNPVKEWADVSMDVSHGLGPKQHDLIVCHQTFNGAKAANGFALQGGISSRYFSKERGYNGLVISGDIHGPQTCGDVVYVGTPYPVHFGEDHRPRVFHVKRNPGNNQGSDYAPIAVPSIRKWKAVLDSNGKGMPKVKPGDQVKLTVRLHRSEFQNWDEIRQKAKEAVLDAGGTIRSLEMEEIGAAESRTKRTKLGPKPSNPTTDLVGTLKAFAKARGITRSELDAPLDMITKLQSRGDTK